MGLASDYMIEQLAPITDDDPVLQVLAQSMMAGFDELAIVSHNDDFDGQGILLDVDEAPAWGLNWLAQLPGAAGVKYLAESAKRAAIKEQKGLNRGKPSAIESAIKETLTGTKYVFLQSPYNGSAYQVLLVTHTSETTDAAVTAAVARAALPAGRILTHTVTDGQTYAEAEAAFATYTLAEAGYATYTLAEAG